MNQTDLLGSRPAPQGRDEQAVSGVLLNGVGWVVVARV